MSTTHTANTSHTGTFVVSHRARMTPPALVPDTKSFPELEIFLSDSPLKADLTDIILRDKFSC